MKKHDCPICLHSSGFTAFTGKGSQICSSCGGTGKVSKTKLLDLVETYGIRDIQLIDKKNKKV